MGPLERDGLNGGGRSLQLTRLHLNSLFNRENTGNFCKLAPKAALYAPETSRFLGVFGRIPYSLEQGKFWTQQGIRNRLQGIYLRDQRS